MRQTSEEIKARALQNLQSTANNNNPTMQTIVSRPRTPIFNKRFWQETIITAGANASCTSVAVRRMDKYPDKVYVAYVSGGTLTVKSAMITYPIKNMMWSIEATISNCVACALEFDGSFVRAGRDVEYRTESTPWLFYTTASGELWAGILGGSFEILAASGATTIDVVRGIASTYKDVDQGLIVFYILNSAVYYRQRIAGVWQGQQQVTMAPANPVQIKVERLFDYRICLQITDASGALWEVFTKMEASGWNGAEYISVSLSQKTQLIPIKYYDRYEAENITVSLSQITALLYNNSPVMIGAKNVDDGIGNFGLKVNLTWDERILGEAENAGSFVLSDGYGGAYAGQSIAKTGHSLLITFVDFNNLVNPVTLSYTPGTLMGDVVAVNADSIAFDAVGLLPTAIPAPVSLSAENINAKQIIVSFDDVVESTNWVSAKAGFTVTAQEYDTIPAGVASLKTYVIDTASYPNPEVTDEDATLSGASMTDVEILNGVIMLSEDI